MPRTLAQCSFALFEAVSLLACSADHYEPVAGPALEGEVALEGHRPAGEAEVMAREPVRGEGLLELATRSVVTNFLGATKVVVEDGAGRVIGGIEEETTSVGAADGASLSLSLPAADGYRVHLSATTQDAEPTICRATVGPIRIDAGAAAQVRVFGWDCGDRKGYVPQAAADDCYWLADWSFVGRTLVEPGESLSTSVFAPSSEKEPLTFRWSTQAPELGDFSAPDAAATGVTCLAAGEKLEFQVTISDGVCEQRVKQAISCREAEEPE